MPDRIDTPALRYAVTAALYVGAYVMLDWVSYIHPIGQLAITPWNPPPGLSLFLLLRSGVRYAPALFPAAYLGDVLVRGADPLSPLTLAASLVLASGYAAIGTILVRTVAAGRELRNVRDVNALVAAAIAGPLVVGLAFVGLNVAFGALPPGEALDAILQFWIGDAIGIVVTTPLLMEFANRSAVRPHIDPEMALQAGAVLLALWIVFGIAATDEFKFFYVLFLPQIWIAMRRGLKGALVANLAIQIGLIAAGENIAAKGFLLREFQFLMLALALTALYLGMAVTERRAAQRTAAAREAALHRALRAGTAGELAAAIAHELNQPLTAIGTYARAGVLMLDDASSRTLLRETLDKVVREVARAGDVIGRLRAFFRTGATLRERIEPEALVRGVVDALAPRLAEERVRIELICSAELPAIDVDRVQMEMVLHNLLVNSVEALAARASPERSIRVSIETRAGGYVRYEVADNGPGIPDTIAGRLFEPFVSTKSGGMGLGLAMSRSIVEAHGGTLG
ncbi:MAG TPA: ATP-binding protein, partial [Casimicrobiaceae bacterium]|nr:ATP-binding protein [Casimicrobiaceae bacterium]